MQADALDEFTGGVILVSHDSRLILRVCEDEEKSEIWGVEDGTVRVFPGNFEEHKEELQREIKAELNRFGLVAMKTSADQISGISANRKQNKTSVDQKEHKKKKSSTSLVLVKPIESMYWFASSELFGVGRAWVARVVVGLYGGGGWRGTLCGHWGWVVTVGKGVGLGGE
ncbi:ABC transporter F family member 4 [Prunus yedoensis var. nudiflora]|uniref:ABC transporter F family member 4 n=1 Tax=Prunus yedoensis var. nudiflora TaxID=2094558 RepID=A0A314YYX6_PRUYE|nr:ABC transporter F family member 4 [Prunus yedoensis var. nudiflora]